MTWDVPVKDICPQCGKTLFKRSARGAKKTFCINETCPLFVPEEQRGGWRKKTASDQAQEDKPAEGKTAGAKKPAAAKKTTAKKTTAKKAAGKTPTAKAKE